MGIRCEPCASPAERGEGVIRCDGRVGCTTLLCARLPAIALLAALSACGLPSTSREIRKDSLAVLGKSEEGMEEFYRLAMASTVSLLCVETELSLSTSDGKTFLIVAADSSSSFRECMSALITEDGYMLSASHCISDKRTVFAVILDHDSGHIYPVRTVWAGDWANLKDDLALLKVEVEHAEAFRWASGGEFAPGSPVAVLGGCTSDPLDPTLAAGRMVREGVPESEGEPTFVVSFKAPIGPGDSGGPLLTADGRLVGIFTVVEVPILGGTAFAVRPDLDWLADVIRQDREAHPRSVPPVPAADADGPRG